MGDLFMPHGMCFLWQTDVLLLHVLSDSAIALAYFSIPLAIVSFVRRRTDLEYKWVFGLFATFIVACGVTHVLGVWVIWNPDYWIDGTAKAVTAGVSVATAALLWPLLPKLLALPSPAQLRTANESLENEIRSRTETQAKLERLNRELEERVEERTRELERSNQELETFARHASHDLKAPLRAINQLSQWIEMDLGDQATGKVAEYQALMRSRIKRMNSLLDALLEYSRVGRTTGAGDEDVLDIGELVADAVLLASPPSTFTVETSRIPEGIRLKRMPLQQVLLNLVSNSIKHHDRDDGRIEISVQESETDYVIVVRDDGPGIAPEFHEDVFELFRTLRPRDEAEASGVGLTIVKKAVDSAGGRIELESAEGAGATFTVYWPKGGG